MQLKELTGVEISDQRRKCFKTTLLPNALSCRKVSRLPFIEGELAITKMHTLLAVISLMLVAGRLLVLEHRPTLAFFFFTCARLI